MRFIHISDTHFGAFSSYGKLHSREIDEFINLLNLEMDFLIIAGDIFNTPVHMFDGLDRLISSMKSFVEKGKKIYVVPGSHDISGGISLFNILESAGIIKNVARYEEKENIIELLPTRDERTGVYIYGIGGEVNSREVDYFKKIRVMPERNSIFVFHSPVKGTIGIEGTRELDIADIPEGFSYYAGGHVHKRILLEKGGSYLVYPGPFFASSFDELYDSDERGYVVVNDFVPEFVNVNFLKISKFDIECDNRSSEMVMNQIIRILEGNDSDVAFFNLRGKISYSADEINLGGIPFKYRKRALILLRKKDLEGIEEYVQDFENIENDVTRIKNPFPFDILRFSEKLKIEKEEGEKNEDFRNRLIKSIEQDLKMVEGYDNKGGGS